MVDILKFMILVGKFKIIKCIGWVYCGVKLLESVLDYMYWMVVMSFFLNSCEEGLNINWDYCIKLVLVYDMVECIVGDIILFDGVSKEEKYKCEKEIMEYLLSLVGEEVGKEFLLLWKEYEV